jgi:hypothetical protein
MRLLPGVLVAVLVIPGASQAQPATTAPENSRFFLETNFLCAASSLAQPREFTSLFRLFGEVASTRSTYPKPSTANPFSILDLGGGVMLVRKVGVGLSVSRTAYEDVADLGATIPNPFILNAPATGTGTTNNRLERREIATHLFLAIVPIRTDRYQLRFFGGPSWITYSADMVSDVSYELNAQNVLTITGFTSGEAKGSTLGVHLGGDFAYFITKRFGIASGMRFSRGTVTVDREPLSTIAQEVRVGSRQFYVGARFRFGF